MPRQGNKNIFLVKLMFLGFFKPLALALTVALLPAIFVLVAIMATKRHGEKKPDFVFRFTRVQQQPQQPQSPGCFSAGSGAGGGGGGEDGGAGGGLSRHREGSQVRSMNK